MSGIIDGLRGRDSSGIDFTAQSYLKYSMNALEKEEIILLYTAVL